MFHLWFYCMFGELCGQPELILGTNYVTMDELRRYPFECFRSGRSYRNNVLEFIARSASVAPDALIAVNRWAVFVAPKGFGQSNDCIRIA